MARKTWVQDPKTGKLIPKEEWNDGVADAGYYVQGDIQPYQSMVTGEMVGSRGRHREILRDHRLVEVGDQTQHLKLKPRELAPGRKEMLSALADQKLRNR